MIPTVSRRSGTPRLISALIVAQIVCASFFVVDVGSDIAEEGGKIGWHLSAEVLAVVALCTAIALEVRYVLDLLRRKEQLEHSVSIASAAMHDVIEGHFNAWNLTPSERDVAMLLVKGLNISQIAQARGNAEGTIKSHLNSVYKKSGTTGRGDLLSVILDSLLDKP